MKGISSFLCLSLFLSFSLAAHQEFYVRSHSLQPPFIDADLSNRYWEFGGSTVVSTNQYVRLTPDRQSKKGWLWSKLGFNYPHWTIEFEFKVEGQGSKVFGDGMAFWVTKERGETGPIFGNRDKFNGLGIFFDTYANSKHKYTFPYVYAMVGDGQQSFSIDDDNEKNNLAGCEAKFRKSPHPTKAKVKYVLGKITMLLDIKGKNEWEECFSIDNVNLSGPHYIGFSGMTGDVADNHDVLRVTSNMVTVTSEEQKAFDQMMKLAQNPTGTFSQEPPVVQSKPVYPTPVVLKGREKTSPPPSEGMSGLTIFLILLVVVFLGGIGFVVYRSQATKRNKRF